METVHLLERDKVIIPDWVSDLESFRRWIDADDIPEKANVYYLDDKVWIDMSKEQIFSHVLVKTELFGVLRPLVKAESLGLFLADGARLTNLDVNFSVRPDATFVSQSTIDAKGVRLVEGMDEGFVELEGSPDMVLEVVSESSVKKDTERLKERYWQAGIREYWLIDARKEPVSFNIFRYSSRGYTPTRKQDGWMKSAVFGKAFRLLKINTLGHPDFTLEVR